MKRVQRTFAYRGWTIQCDRSGLIWDIKPEGGFYDGCYKSREAAELAVDKALVDSRREMRKPTITARQEGRHSGSINASSRAKRTREYLTADEMDKLLTAAKTASRNPVRDYCALLLMFRHGLRVSELCSIKLADIDVAHKTFHVSRLKDSDSGPHDLLQRREPSGEGVVD